MRAIASSDMEERQVVNVQIPAVLKRAVDAEGGLIGLRITRYTARALLNQMLRDRAARRDPDLTDQARVKQARAEADRAMDDEADYTSGS
jgi:hypothetical protein